MNALLDTHTFLWAISANPRLSHNAEKLFVGPSDLWISMASIWEIIIKSQVGRMPLPTPVGSYVVKKLAENRIQTLPITLNHVMRVEDMSMHHRDPFDRMLIAQALDQHLPIVTADPIFSRYPVDVIW
jgi:PIN domain nuclease of toxin-antitoxin system